ncbi:hypothetical protein [Streptomyces sp. NPDC017991]|uniref:hypothetical protein n=1 Tax=Streptomyces sp. NPDC017991 TaxID=3365026 RepID=UPI0037B8EB88
MASRTGARPATRTRCLACVATPRLLTASLPKLPSCDARTNACAHRRAAVCVADYTYV